MGRGFGPRAWFPAWGNPYAQPVNEQQELSMLKSEADMLKADLKSIQDQIAALEKNKGQESQ